MKRKIFISINLLDRDKKGLIRATEKWQDLPVRWSSEENLHITLSFLGYAYDSALGDICEKVRIASQKSQIFDIALEEIILAPNSLEPKMIWLTGAPNEELRLLQENIEKELGVFQREKKAFRPHCGIN